MKTLFYIILGVVLGSMAYATNDRIVAVVNDQIITLTELQARTQLAARAMGLGQVTPQQASALQRRTLGELVDEQLQAQYANTQGLTLTRAEFTDEKDAIISNLGQQTWSQLSAGLGTEADAKLRAEATWARIMAVSVRPRVQLGSGEIDQLIEEMSKTQNRTEKNLSLIFVPIEANSSPSNTVAVADRVMSIRSQVTADTATIGTFAELAKTHSTAPSAAQGGALGWMTSAEVPTSINAAINGLEAGAVSQPLRTPEGWLLVRVNEVRTGDAAMSLAPRTEYNLALLATTTPSDTKAQVAIGKQISNFTKANATLGAVQAAMANSSTLALYPRSSLLGWVPLTALQPDIAKLVQKTKPGSWSDTLVARGQINRFYVAETRQMMPPEVIALRKRVADNLTANRTELEARRFMRELRQRAFVDIRL